MLKRIALSLAALTLATLAHAADPAALVAAKRDLQAAVTQGNPDGMLRARAAFAGLVAAEPANPALHYWVALSGWRALPLVTETDKEAAKKLCKESIAACDRALAAKPKFADAIALKAGLQALSLTFNPAATMTLGPEMDEAYGRAEGMDGDNPRVLLLKGINTLHKPAFVGGGPDKARPLFERAIALSAAPTADSTAIDWGRADAHIWAGVCLGRLDQWGAATAEFRKALAMNPGNAWVTHRLLPDAEKKAAAKGAK